MKSKTWDWDFGTPVVMCGGYVVGRMTSEQRNRFHEYAIDIAEIRAYLFALDQIEVHVRSGDTDAALRARGVEIEAGKLAYQISKDWWEKELARMEAEKEQG